MGNRRHPTPNLIDRYVRGRLPGKARDALERHFMACQKCFELVRLRLGAELVGTLSGGAVPPDSHGSGSTPEDR